MGIYINPTNGQSKEEWLADNASEVSLDDASSADFTSVFPVCLVDNGWMKAAAVGYNEREFNVFGHSDGRPKKWFVIGIDKLSDSTSGLMESEIYSLTR